MNRQLAKELKAVGFPVRSYQVGHKFYPDEDTGAWPEIARRHGVVITAYELDACRKDIENGYYCPALSELIEARGRNFSRLGVEKEIWTAESHDPANYAIAHSPEGAVARLWLKLRMKNWQMAALARA